MCCFLYNTTICWCFKTVGNLNNLDHQLQENLNSLYKWSLDSKCIHISFRSKIQTTYHIGLSPITTAITHRDLGILVSSDLSWEPHYQSIIAKSYKLLGLLRRTFSNHNSINSKKQLYISLVCSKPHLIKHIQLFEQVQRRATKYVCTQ